MTKLFNAFLLTFAAGSAAALLWKKAAAGAAARQGEKTFRQAAPSPEAAFSEEMSGKEVEADALSDAERALLVGELRAQL